MIGARMGKDSGLFAVDFDLYKPGAEQYMTQLQDQGLLNATQVHTTQSGGIHLLYRGDGEYPNCKPHEGVEVKGEGGYIIVPPSQGYKVAEKGIAYAQANLVAAFKAARKSASQTTVDALKQLVLSAKAFHDPLAQIAARRSAQGWPPEKVQAELQDLLSASVAREPSHSRHSRWKYLVENKGEEFTRIVGSGHEKFNPHKHTQAAAELGDKIDSFMSGGTAMFSYTGARPQEDGATTSSVSTEWQADQWPFSKDGYFSNTERNIFEQNYIAYPLFAERESVLIAAEPKVGKTAIALKLAMQVAYGESLGDNFLVTESTPVLYFTLEGARAVEMRIRAELDIRDTQPVDDLLFVVDRPHNFGHEDHRKSNCNKIVAHSEQCKKEFGKDLGLIVIDTLTKAMPGKDQNSVEDTSALFEMIGELRQAGVKATIVFIHHLSKQGNVRGSTNIEAEVDLVLGVEKKEGLVEMNVRRARSMDEDVSYVFEFRSQLLGETAQGFQLHAPTVHLAGTKTSGTRAAEAVKQAQIYEDFIAMGKGVHNFEAVLKHMQQHSVYTAPKSRRPKPDKQSNDVLIKLMGGKERVTYKNFILELQRKDGNIWALKILEAT